MNSSAFKTILVAAAVAAIASGGVAVANHDRGGGESGGDDNGRQQGPRGPQGGPRGHRPPNLLRNLTYAELHRYVNGRSITVRIDVGKVKSVGEDSLTIEAADGSEVTIAFDGDTAVRMPRNPDAEIGDLETGTKVMVERTVGKAARSISVVPPKPGNGHGRSPGDGQGDGDGGPAGDA